MVRRTQTAVFAMVGALLVVTAMPAMAATPDDLASIHITDSDFNNAATLDTVTVEGSGSSASVALDLKTSYNVVDDSGDGSADTTAVAFVGDTSGDNVVSTELQLEPDINADVETVSVHIDEAAGSDYGATVDVYAVQEAPDGTTGEGTLVRSNWNPDWTLGTQDIALDTSFTVESGETWTLEFVTSGTDSDGTTDLLKIDGDGDSGLNDWKWDSVFGFGDVGGNVTIKGTSTKGSGTYIGDTHAADNVEEAFTQLTLDNASATVTWQYYDGNTWVDQSSKSYTSSGNKTVSWGQVGASTGQWRVNVTFQANSGATTAEVDAEGVEFDARSPSVDNSSMTPRDGEKTSNETTTLEVSVSDADFGTGQGDTVTVEYQARGPNDNSYSTIGSKTTGSNGTVTLDHVFSTGGKWDWRVVVTDSYGESETSASQSFKVPGKLYIRNVSNESQLVKDGVTVTVRFFGQENGSIVTRETTDGVLNLTGLPVNELMVVTVDASNQYYGRTATIDNIYEQQSVFLLNNTNSGKTPTFQLDDKTGNFPASETRIKLQKPINRSNYNSAGTGVRWTTIEGDFFDASEEFTATLESDKRYRIVVVNGQNDTRVLGHYVADSSDIVILPIGRVTIDTTGNTSYAFRAETTTEQNQDYIRLVYRDEADQTDKIVWNITERGNASNTIVANTTVNGPLGSYSELTAVNTTEKSYTVNVWISRNGEQTQITRYAGQVPSVCSTWGIDPRWAELLGWVGIVAFSGLTTIVSGRLGAITAVSTATLFTWMGCTAIPSAALGLAGATALLFAVSGVNR